MDDKGELHIVMLPWLAMGHIIPFLELSKCLAGKGHKISFVSTGRNMKRLPKIPSEVSTLINLVEVSLPYVDNMPENAEATIDLPPSKVHYLKKAFDGLKDQLHGLLKNSAPDWIIYDFASYWLPPFAAKLGIPCAFLSLFNATAVALFGPPHLSITESRDSFNLVEDLNILVPKWIDFPSTVCLPLYEVLRVMDDMKENDAEVSDRKRYGLAVEGSDVVFVRTCAEFEQFWLRFLEEKVLEKPVIPVGLLPPSLEHTPNDEVGEWTEIKAWFDKQRRSSVVYVALGTEATLTQDELNALALGLEQSELPFFWVLRKPLSASVENDLYMLPTGFEDRVRDRGVVYSGWVPQVKILAHPSVGGFLTHCGWNSIIESLSFGCPLILLPLISEQGINARALHGDKIGLQIQRNKNDGSFTADSVAETVKMVIVDEKGEIFREKAKEMREIFGNMELNDQYLDKLIQYLQDHKHALLPK